MGKLTIRRALMSVSDKAGLIELGQAFKDAGVEIVATGRTFQVLSEAGIQAQPIETLSGSPEAFQGRMKTLSFPVCGGILYRRGDARDERDLARLKIQPVDCVVVNFYPFEATVAKPGISRQECIEEVDIGGPTLVRAAAKNSPDVLVLTDPSQYSMVIEELKSTQAVRNETVDQCAKVAWQKVLEYDSAIAGELGPSLKKDLRYGENPHQKGRLEFSVDGPIDWKNARLELSYNNILDLSAAYALASELIRLAPDSTGVVIFKHNSPCGVALVPRRMAGAQQLALAKAWEGDPVSAFGGVVVFTDPIGDEAATWLSQYFIELIAAPELAKERLAESAGLQTLLAKRKNLKTVEIKRFGEMPEKVEVLVPGGRLIQTADSFGEREVVREVTQAKWPAEKEALAQFGILVCKALKSNAVAIVREINHSGIFQLMGAGQGQPNRIEALSQLAIPRAQAVLKASEGEIGDAVLVSDAFFPFRDAVDRAHSAGIRWIVQPGGSIKDGESIAACNEHGIGMVHTGVRHFRH